MDGIVRIGTELDDSGFVQGLRNLQRNSSRQLNQVEENFEDVQETAEDMGDAVEQTGREAQQAGRQMQRASDNVDEFGNAMENASDSAISFGDYLKAGFIVEGVTALAEGFMGAVESSMELSSRLSRLETNAQAAGASLVDTKENFKKFAALTGEADSSVEALSNLLQTGFDQNQIAQAIETISGAVVAFPDTLNIESLADGIQETIKSGTAAGQFAELLDRMGLSSENFQNKLDGVSTEAERQQLVLKALADTGLSELYKQYEQANGATLKYKDAQVELQLALNTIVTELLPPFANGLSAIANTVTRLTDAFSQGGINELFSEFGEILKELSLSFSENFPQFIELGGEIVKNIGQGIINSIPTLEQVGSNLLTGINNAIFGAMQKFALGPEMVDFDISQLIPMTSEGMDLEEQMRQALVGEEGPTPISLGDIIEIQPLLPEDLTVGQEIVQNITDSIINGIPQLTETVLNLMQLLGENLKTNLPILAETGLEAVKEISGSLRENAGLLVDGAIELAKNLAQGLIDSIPAIVKNVPEIVTNIAGIIIDNAPKLLMAALELIIMLAKGLIQNIPVIVQNLPQIINAIVNVLLAFNWLSLGKNIITLLKNGITGAVGLVKTAGSQVIEAIKGGFTNLPSQMLQIGKNLIQGLVNGVLNAKDLVIESVKNLGGAIISGIKAVLGIHSPSRVMRDEVGKFIPQGIAVGISQGGKYVITAMDAIAKKMINATEDIQSKIAEIEATAQKREAEKQAKEREKQLANLYKKLEEAEKEKKQEVLDEIADLQAEWNEEQLKEQEEAEKELLQAQIDRLEEFKEKYEETIEDITGEYKDAVEDVLKEQESLQSKLADFGDLFKETDEGFELTNLQDSIDMIDDYSEALDKIKAKGIPDTLMSEIMDMDIDEATSYINELLKMSDDDYDKYLKLWAEKQSKAEEIAKKTYQGQLDTLQEEFTGQLQEELQDLPIEMLGIGEDTAQGMADGMINGLPNIRSVAARLAREAINSMKSELDINSPSKVTTYFGEMTDAGYAKGITDNIGMVDKAVKDMNLFDRIKNAMPQMQSSVMGTLAGIMPRMAIAGGGSTSSTYNEGNFVINIGTMTNTGKGSTEQFLQEAEFYRKQRSTGKGGK